MSSVAEEASATHSISVRSTLQNKHLVATGCTGFLGKVWLAHLLEYVEDVSVSLIIRDGKEATAFERWREIYRQSPAFRRLRDRHGLDLHPWLAERIKIVGAQCTKKNFGMSNADFQALGQSADAVVHFVGLTDFEPDPRRSIDANIHAASHAADLASLTRHKKYLHVSTCFVAGLRNGLIPEEITSGLTPTGKPFDAAAALSKLEAISDDQSLSEEERVEQAEALAAALDYPNIYTLTKGLSEHIGASRKDVDATVFRPAIVECARDFPFEGWNEGINTSGPLVWLCSTAFRRLPARSINHFDVVPVDTVARSVSLALSNAFTTPGHHVVHCGSSDQNPIHVGRALELTTLYWRARHRTSKNPIARHLLRHTETIAFESQQQEVLGFRQMRRLANGLRNSITNRTDDNERDVDKKSFVHKARTRRDKVQKTLRNTDKMLGRVETMLKLFRPFIWDNDYVFETKTLRDLTNRLDEEEKTLFGFDIETLDWRHYWMKVQIPGLQKWSLPLLKGKEVPADEALPDPHEADEAREPENMLDSGTWAAQ